MSKKVGLTEKAFDKFLKDKKIERQLELIDLQRQRAMNKELEALRNNKVVSKGDASKVVQSMLRDKLPAKESSFTQKDSKQAGVSTGYVATESDTGETFILKHFYKSSKDIPSEPKAGQDEQDRQDAVRELLGSTMYQLLLYNRAPKEGLVTPDEQHPNSLYVRSKFFTNATTLSEFSGLHAGDVDIKSSNKLQALEGLEKVMAACDLLGEMDYHGGNLMIQDDRTVTKIDHGKSLVVQDKSFGDMVKARYTMFSLYGYTEAINDGNLSFSIEKYTQVLNQMLQQYDEKQIEAIIDQKFDELAKAGFDPKGITVFPIGSENEIEVNSFDELKQFYKNRMRDSVNIMRDIAQSTNVISKFSDMSDKFRNGGWLEDFAESKIQDPVVGVSKCLKYPQTHQYL